VYGVEVDSIVRFVVVMDRAEVLVQSTTCPPLFLHILVVPGAGKSMGNAIGAGGVAPTVISKSVTMVSASVSIPDPPVEGIRARSTGKRVVAFPSINGIISRTSADIVIPSTSGNRIVSISDSVVARIGIRTGHIPTAVCDTICGVDQICRTKSSQ
jgi:hypothetical protein